MKPRRRLFRRCLGEAYGIPQAAQHFEVCDDTGYGWRHEAVRYSGATKLLGCRLCVAPGPIRIARHYAKR